MIARLKRRLLRLWTLAPVATVLLVLALAATLLFGLRSVLLWHDRHDRIVREQPVAAWMTPGYVAHSWQLPRQVVIETLALDPKAGPPRETLADLAEERGVPVDSLIAELEAAIARHRAAHPAPDGTPPRPGAGPDGGPEEGPEEKPDPAGEGTGEGASEGTSDANGEATSEGADE